MNKQQKVVDYYLREGRLPHLGGIEFDDDEKLDPPLDSETSPPDPAIEDQAGQWAKIFSLPPDQAIAELELRGIAISWDWREAAEKSRKKAFTVSKVMSLDILQLIKDELDESLSEGKSFEDFKKSITPRLEEAGWIRRTVEDPKTGKKSTVNMTPSRLKVIFATNLQSDLMNGRFRQMLQTQKERPYVQIIAVQDTRTTDVCNGLNLKVFRIDDPALRIPPYHYLCRTRERSLSEKDIGRRNLEVLGGDLFSSAGTKPLDGFNAPPLTEWQPDLSKYDPDLAEAFKAESFKKEKAGGK